MSKLKSIDRLTNSFEKLQGVGHRSAERMAYSILKLSDESIEELIKSLEAVKNNVHQCPICGNLTESEICDICSNPDRDQSKIIVVSTSQDIAAFEKIANFNGLYHCLGGDLSAVRGIGIEDLSFDSLLKRIEDNKVNEVIIATNATFEGETTALFLAKLLENKPVEVTRLAYGLPMGGQLEYVDALTLTKALEGRKKI